MEGSGSAAGVVVAAGSGRRLGSGHNKAYLSLAGRTLVSWALRSLGEVRDVGVLVLVVREVDRPDAQWVLEKEAGGLPVEIVVGGATRHESERNAMRHLASRINEGTIDTVLVHDAARPLAGTALAAAVLRAARTEGGAVPTLPGEDIVTVDGADDAQIRGPAGTRQLVRAQTPQGFRATELLAAFETAALRGFEGTDTASCAMQFSTLRLRSVRGDERNMKVTYAYDVVVAERLLATSEYRLG